MLGLARFKILVAMAFHLCFPLLPQPPLPSLIRLPLLIAGQRLCRDHGHHVVAGGVLLKVDFQISVTEHGGAEGCAAGDPVEFAGTQGEQPVAVAEHQVAYPQRAQRGAALAEGVGNLGKAWQLAVAAGEVVQQVAEDRFAVGVADRGVGALIRVETGQLTIVGEGPVLAPEFAGERVGVGQADAADIGLADMADDVFRLDRVLLDQLGNR